jgi:hypothetical protein
MTSQDSLAWTKDAQARLQRVPQGVMRDLTRQRVENLARDRGQSAVTVDLLDDKYRQWSGGSAQATSKLPWDEQARLRVERIPQFVRGMVIQAIETYAHDKGLAEITADTVEEAKGSWGATGRFHQP